MEEATVSANAPQPVMRPWFRRHEDDEWVDEIRFTTVPRFKESGLSGDEWRVSVRVDYMRKGVVVFSESYGRMTWAIAHVARHAAGLHPGDFPHDELLISPEQYRELDEERCMQPGCPEPWDVELEQTHRGCGRCGAITEHGHQEVHRRFCDKHKHRGDSDLDDMDEHYTPVPA